MPFQSANIYFTEVSNSVIVLFSVYLLLIHIFPVVVCTVALTSIKGH